jgi:hypothetical protein
MHSISNLNAQGPNGDRAARGSITHRKPRSWVAVFALTSLSIASFAHAAGINIWGMPQTQVYSGSDYNFRPSVSGTQRTVSFRISNKPAWLAFSTSTGRLYGTPSRWNIGTYSDIIISATDGRTTDRLAAFSIKVPNRRPVISGTPLSSVAVGTSYAFQPSAHDADGHTLTFSVQNKPAWATFSSSSGRLGGTPSSAGTFSNIIISVSDGRSSSTLPAFKIDVLAVTTGSVRLTWRAPTEDVEGNPLVDLAGYRVVYGTDPSRLDKVLELPSADFTGVQLDELVHGTHYFAVKAYTSSGLESELSPVASCE